MSLLTIIGGIVICAIIGFGIIYLIDNVDVNLDNNGDKK